MGGDGLVRENRESKKEGNRGKRKERWLLGAQGSKRCAYMHAQSDIHIHYSI